MKYPAAYFALVLAGCASNCAPIPVSLLPDRQPTPVYPVCKVGEGCTFYSTANDKPSNLSPACVSDKCEQWEFMDKDGVWLCDRTGCERKALPHAKTGQSSVVRPPRQTVTERSSNGVSVIVGASSGSLVQYGYREPYLDAATRIERTTPHSRVSIGGSYSPTPKIQAGNGYGYGFGLGASLRFLPFTIGASLGRGTDHNSKWTKSATRYSLGLGLESSNMRLSLSSVAPLNDPNHLSGWQLDYRLRAHGPLWITASILSSQFDHTSTSSAVGYLAGFEYSFGSAP